MGTSEKCQITDVHTQTIFNTIMYNIYLISSAQFEIHIFSFLIPKTSGQPFNNSINSIAVLIVNFSLYYVCLILHAVFPRCVLNGKHFTSYAFEGFAGSDGFKHIAWIPYYPQINGETVSPVKIAERKLEQSDTFQSLMSYRSSPIQDTGVGAAELNMERKIKTT